MATTLTRCRVLTWTAAWVIRDPDGGANRFRTAGEGETVLIPSDEAERLIGAGQVQAAPIGAPAAKLDTKTTPAALGLAPKRRGSRSKR